MKKAVIYARYSCERQTEQSIEGQLRVCNDFAQKNDFIILESYIDRATTGTNDNRVAFQKMLSDSAKKEWQYVIVYKNDRFARNRIESAINKKTLKDNGVKVVSASENIPDTPEGIILESLLEGMAEYYSAELSQKVKRGLNESRQKKQFTGGNVIYGYNIINKKYIINNTEAEIVRKIYEDYSNGKIVKEIIMELNSKGLKNKQGRPFAVNSIYRMLKLEKYAGIVRHNEEVFTDTIPQIVPKELFDKVQRINEGNKRAPARRKSYGKYILSGKLFCGECGGLMTGESGTSKTGEIHFYYKCFEKKRKHCCTFPSIKKDLIEDKIFDVCIKVLNSGYIPTLIDTAYKIHQEDLQTNMIILNLNSQLAEKEKAIKNIMAAIESGIITPTTKNRLTELEEEIESLKYKISNETAELTKSLTKKDYQDFLNEFFKKQVKNEEFKDYIINLLIRKIVLFRDRLCITFNYYPEDGNKGNKRDYELDSREYKEIVEQCSDSHTGVQIQSQTLRQAVIIRTLNIFIKKEYWGVWIKL